MGQAVDDSQDSLDQDEWANVVGDDDEFDRLWTALMDATAEAEPKAMERQVAQHLATLGARSRRTTEGLILAATATTASEGPGWEDWRVLLHRHFTRDERMDMPLAAAILMELRKTGAVPDWHSLPDQVLIRVVRSFVRDMRLEMEAVEKGEEALPASAGLVVLASELFDLAIALRQEQLDELQNSAEVASLLADLGRQLGGPAEGQPRQVADNRVKARALVEVTIRQLELGPADVH